MSKVFLVDDHALVRDGLRHMLRSGDHEVVGEAEDSIQALNGLRRTEVDLVIVDVLLGPGSGFDVLRALQREVSPPPVLVVTVSANRSDLAESLRLGASGYVLKSASRARMLEAVGTILSGQRHFGAELATLSEPDDDAQAGRQAFDTLSRREQQIADLVVRGRSSASIALTLGISRKTVETYRSRLMGKLGTADITALVRFAIRIGLLDPRCG